MACNSRILQWLKRQQKKRKIIQIPLQRLPREIRAFTTSARGATVSQKIVALTNFVGHDKSIPSTPPIQVNCAALQSHRNEFQNH